MNQDSDNDSSSDSSSDFLVPAGKIDLNSSFFTETQTKPQKARKDNRVQTDKESSDNSENEFDDSNDNNISSAELLSQVLQNLEKTKNTIFEVNINQASTSKTTDQILKHSKDDLSKEINNLLLQGESATSLSKEDGDSSDETDAKALNQSNYALPEKGVEIHLPGQNFMFNKQKKKQQDLQKLLQNKINQNIRKTQVFIHKVGLLSWLCHGFFLNKLINDPELLGVSLSLVSSNNYPDGRVDLNYLEGFTKWFRGLFQVCEINKKIIFTKDYLLSRISEKKIYNYVELILLYIATVRAIGINCRLIISLQPPSLKPKKEQLFQIPISEKNESISKENNEVKVEENKTKSSSKVQNKKKTSKKKLKSEEEGSKVVPKNSQEADKVANLEAKKKAASILAKKTTVIDKHKTDIIDESNITTKKLCLRSNKNVELKKTEINSSENNKRKTGKSKIQPDTKRQYSLSSNEEFSEEENNFSTDEEYVQKKPKKKILKKSKESIALKIAGKIKNQRKLLSSDDEDSIKDTYNFWVEVYVESEESWISVDVLNKKIHCVSEIYKKANHPVLYVVAWNSVGTLKDVTRRYCPHWLTDTRKKRVDEQWWQDTLSTWKENKTAISKAEDEQLLQRELEQPLPKTVSECKGHPLYVLTRHLLKFEALYPPDAVPLGHLKAGEAIYSRHCVHTLYSRESWVKKARVVKPAQEPYKIVKSMPKYDKLSGMKIKDQPLELFGRWQTTPYEPPEAKDGKVPRNAYGNVDLFKMCMLPKGTVYINLPGLSRVARKLNIDCAPACVGFNFGGRGALPAFEGFIVCKEFEDTLREAWEEEQVESQKRAEEKREKRIYGNWKKLIKGLLIREKLAAKYNFREEEDEHVDDVQKSKQKKIEPKKRTDVKKTSTTSKRMKKQPQDSSKKVKR